MRKRGSDQLIGIIRVIAWSGVRTCVCVVEQRGRKTDEKPKGAEEDGGWILMLLLMLLVDTDFYLLFCFVHLFIYSLNDFSLIYLFAK